MPQTTGLKKSTILLIAAVLVALTYSLYLLTAVKSATPFNYFIFLADGFLKGHLYITENPSHLNELIPAQAEGRWYIAYPPMPALIAIPWVVLYGLSASQTMISIIFGAVNVGLMYLVTRRIYGEKIGIILALTLGFGTNHWFLSSEGSAWYIAHILAVFFILSALLVLGLYNFPRLIINAGAARWTVSGLLVGAAYWSRLPAILIVPFFLSLFLFYSDQLSLKDKIWNHRYKILLFCVGVFTFIMANFFYNYFRFGTFSDQSYVLIPGVLDEPWYEQGIFSITYMPKNLNFFFLKMPPAYDKFPFFKPSLEGMSFFLTSPVLVLLLLIRWKNLFVLSAFFTAILMLIPGLLHGTPGFAQFGYRFAMEATPLFLLAIGSFFTRKFWWVSIPLILASILINFWGIYYIRFLNIYGW